MQVREGSSLAGRRFPCTAPRHAGGRAAGILLLLPLLLAACEPQPAAPIVDGNVRPSVAAAGAPSAVTTRPERRPDGTLLAAGEPAGGAQPVPRDPGVLATPEAATAAAEPDPAPRAAAESVREEPAGEAAEPVREELAQEAAEPATEVAEPATEAAEPATEAAEPATEAAEPATAVAEASPPVAELPIEELGPAEASPAGPEPEADPGALAAAPIPEPEATEDRRVVALLLPFSATDARRRALAQAMENAARLAADDLGANAPRLVSFDTAGAPGSAADAARRAIADGAELLLGPLLGRRAVEVQPVAEANGIQVIAFSTDRSVAGQGVYLIGSLPAAEFRRILRFAAVERGYRTLSGILPGNSYGAAAELALQRVAAETGSELGAILRYDPTFESAQTAALAYAEMHRSRFGSGGGQVAVLIPDSGSQLATLAAFLSQQGLLDGEVQLLGTGVWDAHATIREDALRGGWFTAPDPRRRTLFSRRYAERYGAAPPLLAALAYDATVVAGTLIARGGDPFRAAAITDPGGFLGVAGAFRFTPEGLNERALAVLRVEEGGFRIIDPAPDGFPAF